MFENFSHPSRQVIATSRTYATQSNVGAILPSHLLRALAETPDLQEDFRNLNIDTTKLIKILMETSPTNVGTPVVGKLRGDLLSPILKRSLKIIIAKKLKQIEPIHLLVATIECADDALLAALQEAGLNNSPESVFGVDSAPQEPTPIADALQASFGLTDEEAAAAAMVFQIIPGGGARRGDANAQLPGRRPQQRRDSFLDKFAENLTQKAIEGKLDPVIGRSAEVKRITQILARRNKNNPVLLGEPGVGKTAVVEGLAQELLKDSAPVSLRNKKIYALDLPSVVAGTRYRGDFEERIKNIMKEVAANQDIILFIDEIHTLVGSGSGEGSMDGGNIMKPALARGELQTIGATTFSEYKKYFEKDAALERRFQPVTVKEPTVDETVKILYGLRDRYEDFHQVTISPEALQAAAVLSSRYIQDRFLPDKAIDLIDEAAARVKLDIGSVIEEIDLSEIDQQLDAISKAKRDAILQNTYTKASSLNAQEHDLIQERQRKVEEWKKEHPESTNNTVTAEIIADLLAETTGIPVYQLTETETNKLLRMEKDLHKRIIGQNDAVKVLSRTIRRQRTGLKDPNRPIGSFIFAGPTGVGKTELVKALTQFLFNDEKSLISLDMSEYSEKHTVARLFGAPPGYIGYEEGGQLTERIRRNPFSVVLFDEIEKAHPDTFDALLQILEEGRLTDGQGRVVDFKNTVIVMTTNLGSSEISTGSFGFQAKNTSTEYDNMKAKVTKALKESLRPEFLNRVDEVLVFPHLNETELLQIVDVFLKKLNDRVESEGLVLNVSDEAKKKLAVDGYDKALGARPLRRVIQREIETPLSEAILFGKTAKTGIIDIDVNEKNVFTFNGSTHAELEDEIEKIETSF